MDQNSLKPKAVDTSLSCQRVASGLDTLIAPRGVTGACS